MIAIIIIFNYLFKTTMIIIIKGSNYGIKSWNRWDIQNFQIKKKLLMDKRNIFEDYVC